MQLYVDQDESTALMMAVGNGSVEMIQLLINAGVTVNDKDKQVGESVLFLKSMLVGLFIFI